MPSLENQFVAPLVAPPKPRRRWRAGVPETGVVTAKLLRGQVAEVAAIAAREHGGNLSAALRALVAEALVERSLPRSKRKQAQQ